MARENAQLQRSGKARNPIQAGTNAAFFKQVHDLIARFVFPDDCQKGRPRLQTCGVSCHIGGSSETIFGTSDFDNGDRCFRRDSRRVSEPVSI